MSRYPIAGMTCDGCAAAIERAILARHPNAVVQVDLAAGEADITGLTDDEVKQAVEAAGFDLGESGARPR